MLVGTGDPETLARGAATIAGFATSPEKLLGVETLQIAFEAERSGADDLLPPGTGHRQLLDWVRTYIGIELDWDVRLVLRRADVPQVRLGGDTRLGWTTWLGGGEPRDRDDLVLDPERIRRERAGPAAVAA